MFCRYSLDKPGLVLANQVKLLKITSSRFLSQPSCLTGQCHTAHGGGLVSDDLVERFKRFLKTTFGEENSRKPLLEALGYKTNGKGKPQLIRDYF